VEVRLSEALSLERAIRGGMVESNVLSLNAFFKAFHNTFLTQNPRIYSYAQHHLPRHLITSTPERALNAHVAVSAGNGLFFTCKIRAEILGKRLYNML
jgi:hypothetical protein